MNELTIEELERILYTKRRENRLARVRHQKTRSNRLTERPQEAPAPPPASASDVAPPSSRQNSAFAPVQVARTESPLESAVTGSLTRGAKVWHHIGDRVLLLVELLALIGLVAVVTTFLGDIQTLNREATRAQANTLAIGPTATAQPAFLPGGSSPPSQNAEIPDPFRDLVQAGPAVAIPTPGPQAATRLVIPAIEADAPIVEGDGWEELKLGVGHHIGSANPGERGNVVLSGHNDVFGEVFRHLTELATGDEVQVYDSAGHEYRYRVTTQRIVPPTEVSVMGTATAPILTLITCYPYLVDSQRLIVIAELIE